MVTQWKFSQGGRKPENLNISPEKTETKKVHHKTFPELFKADKQNKSVPQAQKQPKGLHKRKKRKVTKQTNKSLTFQEHRHYYKKKKSDSTFSTLFNLFQI